MLTLEESSLDALLRKTLNYIIKNGEKIESTKGNNLEVRGVLLRLKNPLYRLSLSINRGKSFSPLGELLWYLKGSNKLEFIEYYIKKYSEFSDDNNILYGSYGNRIFNKDEDNQFENVFNKLMEKPYTKHALIQVLKPDDLFTETKDLPCTISLQFFIRNKKLELYTFMRSNDIIKGFTHDVFCFSFIQEMMARRLNIDVGSYNHFVTSLHLYDENRDDADKYLLEGFFPPNNTMPNMPIDDVQQSLEMILNFEENIRVSTDIKNVNTILENVKDSKLNDYWKDLGYLLVAFKYLKMKKHNLFKSVLDCFHSNYYKRFIQDRINSKKTSK